MYCGAQQLGCCVQSKGISCTYTLCLTLTLPVSQLLVASWCIVVLPVAPLLLLYSYLDLNITNWVLPVLMIGFVLTGVASCVVSIVVAQLQEQGQHDTQQKLTTYKVVIMITPANLVLIRVAPETGDLHGHSHDPVHCRRCFSL